jgi:hypothetical protein
MTTQARHDGFPAPELDPTPTPGETKLSIDTGGWTKLEDAKTFVNGRRYLSVCSARRLEAEARGRKFHSGLVPYNERGREITTNDMMQVIVLSDEDRCRCVCQGNPYTGIKIPFWFACKHGRSLEMVYPLRTSLLIMDTPELDLLPFVGEPTRKPNDKAMAGILAHGLRNEPGGKIGRTAIMCDPFGPNDDRANMFFQRERDNVYVVVYVRVWWVTHAKCRLAHPNVGVSCLATGAGAILFANVNPYIATVIPMSSVSAVWMRYPFGDHLSRAMRLGSNPGDYGARLGPKCRIGWFSIWGLDLTHENCLPPRGGVLIIRGRSIDIHYRYLPTVHDIYTPQKGLVNEYDPE